MKLEVQKSRDASGTVIFHLVGNLHGTKEGYAFQDDVRCCFADTRRVIVDLAEVGRIDSCGIGILAAVAMSAQNAGAGLVLTSLPPRIEQILGVTHFLSRVEQADSLDEAKLKLDRLDTAP